MFHVYTNLPKMKYAVLRCAFQSSCKSYYFIIFFSYEIGILKYVNKTQYVAGECVPKGLFLDKNFLTSLISSTLQFRINISYFHNYQLLIPDIIIKLIPPPLKLWRAMAENHLQCYNLFYQERFLR